jgi:orotidine-5'-phosphate decarboxylase
VGATVDRVQLGLSDHELSGLSILAPGFGAQGVALSDMGERFGSLLPGVIPTVSRSVAGDDREGVLERIESHRAEVESQW